MNALGRLVINPLGILTAIILSHGFLPGISDAAERDSAVTEARAVPLAPPFALIPGWKMPSGMGEVVVTVAQPMTAAVRDDDIGRSASAE